MAWTEGEAQRIFDELSRKAMTDSRLRVRLLNDPKPVIEAAAGKKIVSEFKIKVIEGDPAFNMTFVLPAVMDATLSDRDLEKVAGGSCGAQDTCVSEK